MNAERDTDKLFVSGPFAPLLIQLHGGHVEVKPNHLLRLESRRTPCPRNQCPIERVYNREMPRLPGEQAKGLPDNGSLNKRNSLVDSSRNESIPVGEHRFMQSVVDLYTLSNGVH